MFTSEEYMDKEEGVGCDNQDNDLISLGGFELVKWLIKIIYSHLLLPFNYFMI